MAAARGARGWLRAALRAALNRCITATAWLLADVLGWRVAAAVLPPQLRGKLAVVSGANSGLGLETTKALLQQGATVVMACRSTEHAHTVRADILRDARNAGPLGAPDKRLLVLHIDLEEFATIPRFVAQLEQLQAEAGLPPVSLLVNNAGVHLKEHKHVDFGFERTMASNYFGHVFLTQLLLPQLKAAAPSRIVNVASVAEMLGPLLYTHRIPWDDLGGRGLTDSGERPYTLAKTLLLMATRELARRLEGSGVDVIATHPGIAASSWYLKSDPHAYWFSYLVARARSIAGPWLGVGQPLRTGAISIIYACIAPELTGCTSDPHSRGVLDALGCALFGGRLAYYGPSYLLQNCWNAWPRWVVNPWCYNRQACARVLDTTLDMIAGVQQALKQRAANGSEPPQQAAAAENAAMSKAA